MRHFGLLLFFLSVFAADAFAQGDTVRTMTGLKYVRLKAGQGPKPKAGDKLSVLYTGKLTNGREFDSVTDQKAPFRFKVGRSEVIPGWEEGFRLMTEGEKGILIVPPHLGYGPEGAGYNKKDDSYDIPPNSTLIFEVELLKIK